MDVERFRAMVARLESESAARPRAYVARVALLAAGAAAGSPLV